MKAKAVVPREQANRDVDEAIAYDLGERAVQAALGFIDALEQAYIHIGRHPGIGSPRYAHDLNLPGLRAWPLTRYPYLVSTSSDQTMSMFGACFMSSATSLRGRRTLTS